MAKQSTISHFSDEELKAELIGREADRRAALNAAQKACTGLVFDNVNLLLALVPKHDTINCSDTNLASAYNDPNSNKPRCRRCRLLEIKQDGYNRETILEVVLHNPEQWDNTPDNIQVRIE